MLKHLKSMVYDRKGIAIEMALLVMVVTFSFSVLITATALLHHDKKVKAEKEIVGIVVTEQIAQSFCSNAGSGNNSWAADYPDYDITVDGLNLTVKEKDSEKILLKVSLKNDAGTYRISSWETQ